MRFNGAPMVTMVRDINSWAHRKARLSGAAATLTSLDRERMGLCSTGRGGDGRCRWRHASLWGLKTAVRRDYGLRALVIAGRCVFVGPGGTAAGY